MVNEKEELQKLDKDVIIDMALKTQNAFKTTMDELAEVRTSNHGIERELEVSNSTIKSLNRDRKCLFESIEKAEFEARITLDVAKKLLKTVVREMK